MTKRLLSERRVLTEKEKLVLRLNEQYPLDVGILSAFFLNLVTLKPGQVAHIPELYSPRYYTYSHVCRYILGIQKSACTVERQVC